MFLLPLLYLLPLGARESAGVLLTVTGFVTCQVARVMFLMVLGLEMLQLSIPGRTPDVTQAILAPAGWLAPPRYLARKRSHPSPAPAPPASHRDR